LRKRKIEEKKDGKRESEGTRVMEES